MSRHFNFGDFTVLKLVLHNKGIDKTRMKKDQENSAYRFGGNYLADYAVKFLQDRIKS